MAWGFSAWGLPAAAPADLLLVSKNAPLGAFFFGLPERLSEALQFNLKHQRCIGRNHPTRAAGTIGQVRGDDQTPHAADLHALHAFIPSGDHMSGAQWKVKGHAPILAGIKLVAQDAVVPEPAGVMHGGHATGGGFGAVAQVDVFILKTGRGGCVGHEGASFRWGSCGNTEPRDAITAPDGVAFGLAARVKEAGLEIGSATTRYNFPEFHLSGAPALNFIANPSAAVSGALRVPGDKSISHRAIMFGAIARGTTHITGFLEGADAISTMNVFRALGVQIEGPQAGRVTVHGVGPHGLRPAAKPLDCGNSGTSMRLLSGLLAGHGVSATLVGDESLSRRPMRRVTDPLALMGARIDAQEGRPPLVIHAPSGPLRAIDYVMPMASAQVKSCVLLAGLRAQGVTRVTEPAPTRDHTERMLEAFGVKVRVEGATVSLEGGQELRATDIDVPADISSAAFFLVAGAIAPQGELLLQHVGINPTRTGVIDILRLMGADITLENPRTVGGESVADLRVKASRLKGIDVPEALVPLAIDEFPVLFVAAACAEGRTVVTGAEELRVKESDRIAVMAEGLKALGVSAEPTPDGIVIEGRGAQGAVFSGGTVNSYGDHRPAMAFAVASLRSAGPISILDVDNVATSFPNFLELATSAGLDLKTDTV